MGNSVVTSCTRILVSVGEVTPKELHYLSFKVHNDKGLGNLCVGGHRGCESGVMRVSTKETNTSRRRKETGCTVGVKTGTREGYRERSEEGCRPRGN